jgi:hypothetical protein
MEGRVRIESAPYGWARTVQPRLLVGLALIVAGLVWALARGLSSFGIGPAGLGYDLDQPPVLLLLVGAWLLIRARGR